MWHVVSEEGWGIGTKHESLLNGKETVLASFDNKEDAIDHLMTKALYMGSEDICDLSE